MGAGTPPAFGLGAPSRREIITMSKKNSGLVEARVLRDCIFGLWGEVAEVPAELLPTAEADGLVDSNADAVAYAVAYAKQIKTEASEG